MLDARTASQRSSDLHNAWGERLFELTLHDRACDECSTTGQQTTCEAGRALWEAEQRAYHSWFTSRWPNEGVAV